MHVAAFRFGVLGLRSVPVASSADGRHCKIRQHPPRFRAMKGFRLEQGRNQTWLPRESLGRKVHKWLLKRKSKPGNTNLQADFERENPIAGNSNSALILPLDKPAKQCRQPLPPEL